MSAKTELVKEILETRKEEEKKTQAQAWSEKVVERKTRS